MENGSGADTADPGAPWEPATVAEVAALFAAYRGPWWIAGGHAIELFVGHPLRTHADIDVAVLRRDQLDVQRVLAGWEWWAADPPGTLRRWAPGEFLPFGIHDIWCRSQVDGPWCVQVMIEEAAETNWVSRRDPLVRLPLTSLGRISASGVPFLAPEVQLLYKSRARRPKDDADFGAALPLLTRAQREWLSGTLTANHPWRYRLRY